MGGNRIKKIIKRILRVLIYGVYYAVVGFLLYFTVCGTTLTDWYDQTFGTSFREIIYTYDLGLTGADASFLNEAWELCQGEMIKATVILVVCILIDLLLMRRVGRKKILLNEPEETMGFSEATVLAENSNESPKEAEALGRRRKRAERQGMERHLRRTEKPKYRRKRTAWGYVFNLSYHIVFLAILIFLAKPVYLYADEALQVTPFLKSRYVYTRIYDKEYVDPTEVKIQSVRKKKRNVIIVYMESMETTYASQSLGGFQKTNLIPNIYQLQQENIAFGDRDGVKGTLNPYGTTWTTAALLASSSGIPFAFNIGKNFNSSADSSGNADTFAQGVTTLGDILSKQGYNQEFICGSDATFGRKKSLFQEHGNYKIFDYYSAIDAGYIDKDYKVWWGLEDRKMYAMAKDEIMKLASKDEPFNCTLLTVDTHHKGGYRCPLCPSGNGSKTANVVACADQQIQNFVDWCKQQDFYKNTTIIILGDHPRMDKKLVKGVDKEDREAINVFINSASPYKNAKKNRTATTMDLFPTILSSMGYSIQGDRLGLGTNLFSSEKTLAEKMGYDKLNGELNKNSFFYHKHFS